MAVVVQLRCSFGKTSRTGKFGVVSPVKVDRKELAEARSKSHRLMRDRTKGSRRMETFQKNDRVLLQDEKSGKFSHKATVIDPRDRKSDDLRSYYIRKDDSGEILLRNRRHFKRLPIQASEAPDSSPQLQNQGPAEPRTRSEHAHAERESLQADSAAERASASSATDSEAWRIAREQGAARSLARCADGSGERAI